MIRFRHIAPKIDSKINRPTASYI